MLDALAYGPKIWSVPMSPEEIEDWEEFGHTAHRGQGRCKVAGY